MANNNWPSQNQISNVEASCPAPQEPKTWLVEEPHPEYSWTLQDDAIWHEGQDGSRQVYLSCGRQNPCLTGPKTSPSGYLVIVTNRGGKLGFLHQEGPGTGNHHGKFNSLAEFDQNKQASELFFSPDGREIKIIFADGSLTIYEVYNLPIDVGTGKWSGINGRIEENITNGINIGAQ